MARKYTKKRTYKKGRKYNRGRRSGTVVGRQVGFPQKMVFKHRYVENITITGTAGALVTHKYKANGMYDTNYTGGGHQPLYFDNASAIYNHYTVIGSRIRLTFVEANNVANPSPCYVGVYVDDDVTALTNAISMMENKQCSKLTTSNDIRQNRYVLRQSFSTGKQYGGSKGLLQNGQFQATPTTDPSELSSYILFVQSMDGSSDCSFRVLVEIDFIAVWTELKPQEYN